MKHFTIIPKSIPRIRDFNLCGSLAFVLAVGACLLSSMLPASGGDTDLSKSIVWDEPANADDLEFIFQLNGWGPWVELTTPGGSEIDIGLDEIIKNVRGIYEFGAGVQMGKWSFYSDVLYIDLKKNGLNQTIDKLNIKEWLVTPKIGYRSFEGDWGHVDLQAGLRYTWVDLVITGAGPLGRQFDEDVDGEVYDGVGGFSGRYNLNDRWFLPFMLEAGTGDSKFVFSAFGGVGYRYKYADVLFGFKYLSYDFRDGAPLQDEKVYGPKLSVRFTF